MSQSLFFIGSNVLFLVFLSIPVVTDRTTRVGTRVSRTRTREDPPKDTGFAAGLGDMMTEAGEVESLSLSLFFLILSYLINTALYLSSFLFSNQNTTRPRHDFWSNRISSRKTVQAVLYNILRG